MSQSPNDTAGDIMKPNRAFSRDGVFAGHTSQSPMPVKGDDSMHDHGD